MGYKFDDLEKTWVAWYSKRHPITRETVSLRRKSPTEANAKRLEKQLIIEVEERIRSKAIPTWGELINMWAQDAGNRGLTPKTVENYLYSLKAYTLEKWSARLVDTISSQEIKDVINVNMEGKSQHSKQATLKFIRCVFQFGVESNYLNRNPTPTIKFKLGDRLKQVLTKDQLTLFLSKAFQTGNEWAPIYAAAIYLGARNGELIAMTWDQVDFENQTITIGRSWSKRNGLKSTKSGDERLVPIAHAFMPVLKELKLKADGNPYVLPRLQQWINGGDQARELRFFLAGLGLPQINFHALRACHAVMLLQSGVPAVKIMSTCGWKSYRTMSFYIRTAGVDIKGMMDGLVLHDANPPEGKLLKLQDI